MNVSVYVLQEDGGVITITKPSNHNHDHNHYNTVFSSSPITTLLFFYFYLEVTERALNHFLVSRQEREVPET